MFKFKNLLTTDQVGILNEMISTMSDEQIKALTMSYADMYRDGCEDGANAAVKGVIIGTVIFGVGYIGYLFIKEKLKERKQLNK